MAGPHRASIIDNNTYRRQPVGLSFATCQYSIPFPLKQQRMEAPHLALQVPVHGGTLGHINGLHGHIVQAENLGALETNDKTLHEMARDGMKWQRVHPCAFLSNTFHDLIAHAEAKAACS